MKMGTIEPENNPFTSLVCDITHRCNMECANCYIPNREIPDMDIEKLYALIKRLPKRVYIRLIGAEPTMRNDLFDIITTVRSLGHKVSVTTNGLKLASPNYAAKLRKTGLKLILISMNGADDDPVYRVLDNGPYGELKVKALINAFKNNFTVNTGTIIAKGVNEFTIREQVRTVVQAAKIADYKFDRRLPLVLRMKSIGAIGNYREDSTYSFDELCNLASDYLDIPIEKVKATPIESGLNRISYVDEDTYKYNEPASYAFNYETELGNIIIRLINWEVDGDGVPDANNEHRGRVTQDFKIAPFFAHVKENEFGY